MKRSRLLITTAALAPLAAMASSAASAHDGHPVPAGVAPHDHLHLAADVLVSSPVLLTVLLGGAALGALFVLCRRPAFAAKGGNGRDTRRL